MDHTPLYIKIKDYIKENIKSGKLNPGDRVPSEKELSDLFNVSRITVSTAIRDLVNDGIVYRIQGKGTFIAEKKEENIQHHSAYGFEDDSNNTLKQGTHITIKASEINASEEIAEILDISCNELVYKLIRKKVIDGLVYAIEYIYLPAKLYPALDIRKTKDELVHDMVDEYCFLKQDKSKIYIKPIIINESDAKILNIRNNTPVLLLEKITFSTENKIIEYSENIINTNIHNFYIELEENDL